MTSTNSKIGTGSVNNAFLNIASLVTLRLIFFGTQAIILRHADIEVLGLVNVRICLLEGTLLGLSM